VRCGLIQGGTGLGEEDEKTKISIQNPRLKTKIERER
jgi:hypothetical protein